MPASKSCPSCGANLTVTTVGPLQDKILRCEFCNYQEDLPDSVTIQSSEVISPYPGAKGGAVVHRKNVVIRRDDAPAPLSSLGHPPVYGQGADARFDMESEMAAEQEVPPEVGSALAEAQRAVASVGNRAAAAPQPPLPAAQPAAHPPEATSRAGGGRLLRGGVFLIVGCAAAAMFAGGMLVAFLLLWSR